MEAHGLAILWFLIIAFFWTGYFVLEGFDFGVGMLMPPVSRNDVERRLVINTIGPVWDGNEVWLVVAAGATFAAFPEWYATMFSGFYIPLLLVLIGLIVRVIGLDYRGKMDNDKWRRNCDLAITFGSWVPAIVWGLAFANLARGVKLDADHQMLSSFWDLLSPFALLGAATFVTLFLAHGSIFIALKTDGPYRIRARLLQGKLGLVSLVVASAFAIWTQLSYSAWTWTWVPTALVVVGSIWALMAIRQRREGWAFTGSAVAIVATLVLIFGTMYPNVIPASNDAANSLTIANASATPRTLTILTWVGAFLTPVILLYQSWTYWVFRKRLTVNRIPASIGLKSDEVHHA